jgi:hypothetical protein
MIRPVCAFLLILNAVCIHFRRTSFDGPLSSSRNWSLSKFSSSDLERKMKMRVLFLSCVLTNDTALLNVFFFPRITVITIGAIVSGWSREWYVLIHYVRNVLLPEDWNVQKYKFVSCFFLWLWKLLREQSAGVHRWLDVWTQLSTLKTENLSRCTVLHNELILVQLGKEM